MPFGSAPPDTAVLEQVDLASLAAREGTPLHVYSTAAIRDRLSGLQAALEGLDALVCYAVKANSNGAILRLMAASGAGADIVSEGELWRCLRAGIPAGRIVFSGVGKTDGEIAAALKAGVLRFNLESRDELDLLEHVAARHGVQADASVRINPDVDARTHSKISTGRSGDKFGVPVEEARCWFRQRVRWPHVRLDGLHMHIGSQLLDLVPVREALGRLSALWRELAGSGHEIDCIDVGGGLGVRYREGERAPDAGEYVALIREAFEGFQGRLVLEPGRYLVAEAGVLLARVVRAKAAGGRTFLVLDAGMNDLARPGLYGAWHDITRLGDATGRSTIAYDVVGPVCESSDVFAVSRALPRCDPGDLVVIGGTGAYGASMASTYNSRPHAAEVLVDGARHALVRRRQSFEELVAGEPEGEAWRTG